MPHEVLAFSEGAEHRIRISLKEGVDLDRIGESMEKKYLLDALKIADGNKTEAARLLDLSFRSFRLRLSKMV